MDQGDSGRIYVTVPKLTYLQPWYSHIGLTHLPLDKIAAISQMIFQMHFHEWNFFILIRISLEVVPRGLTDDNLTLVQIMAWHHTGDKPLSEPMLTQFTDTYMWH